MNPKEFRKFVSRIYGTQENEPGCQQVQSLLPAYVEAEFSGKSLDLSVDVEAHLFQCPDCTETYQALRYLVMLEENEELQALDLSEELAPPELQPQSKTGHFTPLPGS